jgi:hypothetical protein
MNIDFLDYFRYKEPKIVEYHKDNIDVVIRDGELGEKEAVLLVDGNQWTAHEMPSKSSATQVFSHYWFAKGHTICTGLGFGVRENWLLNKKEVTELTILEKNRGVIDYHLENNPHIFQHAEVIPVDANEYTGKCDVLLLDHYETETFDEMARMSSNIMKNIDCQVAWMWPLEDIIFQNHKIHNMTKLEYYKLLKKEYDLLKFPEVTQELLDLFTYTYHFSYLNRDGTERLA